MSRLRRVAVTVLAGTVAAVSAVTMTAAPAQAASEYRWWGYWFASPGASGWTYASVGPAGHRVDDGAVEGWRFAVAVPNPSAPSPRLSAAGAFDRICGGTPRPDGKDRVALVVDFGTGADAPPGEHPPTSSVRVSCVVVDDRSNALDVLTGAGYHARSDGSGLVCGLQGYPRSECGAVVKASSPPKPRPTRTPSRTSGASGGSSADPTAGSGGSPTAPATTGSSTKPRHSRSPGLTQDPSAASSAPPTPGSSSGPVAAVAVEEGPPPPGGSGPSSGALGLMAGVALVAGLAVAAVRRGRAAGGTA